MLAGVVIIEFVMCAIAVVGFAIYSNDPRFFMEDGSINRAMSEEIILRIGFEQVPALVGSMLFAAGVAIILSTGNTFLMVTSTNLSNDILKPYFFKNADSKKVIRIQQVSIAILGLLAYALVTQFQTVLEMAFISYTMIGASLHRFYWQAFSGNELHQQVALLLSLQACRFLLLISYLKWLDYLSEYFRLTPIM